MPPIVSKSTLSTGLDLFVDLDGTLIAGDIAEESLARTARNWRAFVAAAQSYSAGGLSGLKRSLATSMPPDVTNLPFREDVLDYIRGARAAGRRVVLATAADKQIAVAVADHLGLFDAVIASEPGRNMKGEAKLHAIQDMAAGPFEYLGDSAADVPIWQAAERSGFVAPSAQARHEMKRDPGSVSLHIEPSISQGKALMKAMRPHQWAKNVLVFVPILFAHEYVDPGVLLAGLMAFVCFSLCASGVYLVNDIIDIEADRKHATKHKRPFAAGHLSIRRGLLAAGALLGGSVLAAFAFVNVLFGLVLASYAVLTTAYTFCLKRYSTVDVVALSLLYTWRILAGSAATALAPSPWLLSYSLFFFLSLAYMKRYIEIDAMKTADEDEKLPSRNYYASEVQLVLTFGIANGALSVLTLAQYVNSTSVEQFYSMPFLLWLIVPVMMFWIYRTWTWASRGKIGDDPVVFALKDRISRICVGIVLLIIIAARVLPQPGGLL
ncbi:UbiA family prenyltransferase [Marivita sp. S6314]|uniref:UbiA family prenyltransferase n=1 Tax=Marivita sp. S6314 TaxID=2926406 RepID=UPI001FF4A0E5|nr:UbiA family prenyltransferase [Marivita sp. S6314]MCK0149799.1 UbiA family prenyltransferase [Marivita sp. S6314]